MKTVVDTMFNLLNLDMSTHVLLIGHIIQYFEVAETGSYYITTDQFIDQSNLQRGLLVWMSLNS
jgi:hypothetical protein